ncbi:MAG: DUF3102 domain-containing protein [Desulfosporosinus sp.]|nr:DUF3102 domain-containing protein [Desulfosporosinus sp.]
MQVCEEYEAKLLASSDSDRHPDSSLVTNLTYTQALILLEIQEEEGAQFTIHRDNLIKSYAELLKMLTVLDRTDPEMKEKYRDTASKIVENMAKTLKICKTKLSINTTHSERG